MIGGVSASSAYAASPYSSQALQGQTLQGQARQGQAIAAKGSNAGGDDLTDEEKAQVAKLKAIDAKVRAHERAHTAAGGQYAGAPSYSYTRGPDGRMYATAGEVSIDIGAENDPHATLRKAAQVAAAALAPADPSGADRAVAAAAQKLRLQALAEIRAEKQAEQQAEQQQKEVKPGGGDAPSQAASRAYGAANSRLDQSIGRAVAFSV